MEHKDELMKHLLKSSQLKMPYSDFENRVMQTIEKEDEKAVSILQDRKKGVYFFLAGMLFGLVLNYLLISYLHNFSIHQLQQENALLVSQLIYALLILFFVERLVKLYQLNRMIKGL
ncbi:hypothetical protein LZQ00_03700 [Sphingobacterium sp. SRCM116780]|uniref:hypothetical protein n=1 Tax=Sphingobacterium sp. SRCM116780 TaxID=2907623 RepID=UPI001F374256|nr:hypothetical protein [Sphingobacterium sp. SRCM116780]UIR56925.1 hypothetical protein LZQ00_03700 [Sphingobacterium sp. SRCM116780]